MSTDVDTAPTTRDATRDRIFLAVILLTAGAMLLIDRLVPGRPLGDAVALVLGLELLAWAFWSRADGPLVGGGVVTGVGIGVLLADGPLQGREPEVVGGAWLLALGLGFALVAGLARPLRVGAQDWAWIPAACLAGLGAAIATGVTATAIAWAGPVVLLGVGAGMLLRRSR